MSSNARGQARLAVTHITTDNGVALPYVNPIKAADAASDVWEPIVNDLKKKLNYLWGWIGFAEIEQMRDFDPEFVEYLKALHQEVDHAEE